MFNYFLTELNDTFRFKESVAKYFLYAIKSYLLKRNVFLFCVHVNFDFDISNHVKETTWSSLIAFTSENVNGEETL